MYCRGVKERLIYPHSINEPGKVLEVLLDYLKNNEISALFPAGGPMSELVVRNQSEFKKYTNLLLPCYESFKKGLDKILTLKTAKDVGCPIPETWYPEEEPIEEIAQKIKQYPVLIKPAVSSGSRGITFCDNSEKVISNYKKVSEQFGSSFVQEFIPSGGMQYKVDAVMDQQQRLYAGMVYAKLRYYPPMGGSSVLNKTELRPDILEPSVRIMKELKWIGICDFDYITDPRDGVVKLMEINPRFPESYRATVAGGVDMTKIIYKLAVGEKVEPQLDYEIDKYNRFLFGDIMWFLRTKENRWSVKPNFFDFFRRDTYYQLMRKSDFGPILGYLIENMAMFWDSKLRKERIR